MADALGIAAMASRHQISSRSCKPQMGQTTQACGRNDCEELALRRRSAWRTP